MRQKSANDPQDRSGRHGHAAWVEIDSRALAHNVAVLQRRAGDSKIAAVLKADAYGHGAPEIAPTLVELGVDLLIVARTSEARELRQTVGNSRILVLAPPSPAVWEEVLELDLEVACSTPESLEFLVHADSGAQEVPVHVKVNTGMNRLGIRPELARQALSRLDEASGVRPTGICSHLADADRPSSPRTAQQHEEFGTLLRAIHEEWGHLETHLANSAGLLGHDLDAFTYCRLGIALYGYNPAGPDPELHPVMAVRGRVLQVHELAAGDKVGYGGIWQAPQPTRVATVGVGYGDGYPFHQRQGHQIGGPFAAQVLTDYGPRPIVGTVSMDMLAFACAEGDPIEVGSQVTLLGEHPQQSGGSSILDAHRLAHNAETIPWEILLRLGRRLPRVYLGH